MNVDGLGNGMISRLDALSDGRPARRSEGGDPPGRSGQARPVAKVPEPGEAAPDSETGEARAQGVIRLLEEGHFKGVADVRLRINFYDELSARAADSGAQSAATGTGELIDNVIGKAQELVSGWGLGEDTQKAANDLLSQFETAAQAALGDSTSDGVVDTTALGDALGKVFASFAEQLTALAPPPPADPVDPASGDAADPTATEPQPTEPPADPQTPPAPNPDIGSLAQFFGDELAKLLASIGEASQLPPLTSQPSGNGKAYDKFVAIYNGLSGQAPPAEPPADPADEQVNLLV